jgi:hypothetical protein
MPGDWPAHYRKYAGDYWHYFCATEAGKIATRSTKGHEKNKCSHGLARIKHGFYDGLMPNTPNTTMHRALKFAVYLLGAIYGFVGVSTLWFSQFVFRFDDQDFKGLAELLGVLTIVLGIYLLYVAYLILWRFSAAGLKHACIVSAFYVWTLISRKDGLNPNNELLVWGSLIGVSIAVILIYRSLNRLLISGMR